MTSDGEALFRAICEQPWEDTPRLVYADWLDETGCYNRRDDPAEARLRAAFIRHQIRMARGDEAARSVHPTLMSTTFRGCVERWGAELPKLPGIYWECLFFQRGFVPGASFNAAHPFAECAEQLFNAAPVSGLSLYQTTAAALGDVLRNAYLRRVQYLDVNGRIGDEGAALIAASPNLSNLLSLRLVNVGMGDAGLETLARSQTLGELRELSFDANRVTDRGAAALVSANSLTALKVVRHKANAIHQKAEQALIAKYRRS